MLLAISVTLLLFRAGAERASRVAPAGCGALPPVAEAGFGALRVAGANPATFQGNYFFLNNLAHKLLRGGSLCLFGS